MPEVSLRIDGENRGALSAIRGTQRGLGSLDSSAGRSSRITGALTGTLKKATIAVAALGAAAGVAAVVGLKKSISAASDLNEAVNVTGLVFTKGRAEIEKFVKSAASIGLSERQARDATAQFGGLLTNMGLAAGETVKWSKDLTVLASDMGSAFNEEPVEVIRAIGAGLRGETEPLRRFNVMLSQEAIAEEAVRLGLVKTKKEMDNAAKARAALSLITKQTSAVQGDFANTSDGLANSQRILRATIENTQASIGTALLPAAQAFVKVLQGSIPFIERYGVAFSESLAGAIDTVRELVGALRSDEVDSFGDVLATVSERLGLFEQHADTIRGFGDAVGEVFGSTVDFVQERFGMVLDFAQRAWPGIQRVVVGVFETIAGVVRKVMPIVASLVQKAGDAIRKHIGPAIEQMLRGFKSAMPFIENIVLPLLKGVAEVVLDVVVVAFRILGPVIETLGRVLGWLGTKAEPLRGFFEFLGNVIGIVFFGAALKVAGFIATRLVPGFGRIVDVGSKVVGFFRTVSGQVGRFGTMLANLSKGPLGVFRTALGAVRTSFAFINSWIQRILAWGSKLGGFFSGIGEKLSWLPGVGDGLQTVERGLRSSVVGSPVANVHRALWPVVGFARTVGGVVTSTFRPGATTRSGRRSLHGTSPSQAVDIGGPRSAMEAVFRMAQRIPGVSEIILNPWLWSHGRISNISGTQLGRDHIDHVHVGWGGVGEGTQSTTDLLSTSGSLSTLTTTAKPLTPGQYRERSIAEATKSRSQVARILGIPLDEADLRRLEANVRRLQRIIANMAAGPEKQRLQRDLRAIKSAIRNVATEEDARLVASRFSEIFDRFAATGDVREVKDRIRALRIDVLALPDDLEADLPRRLARVSALLGRGMVTPQTLDRVREALDQIERQYEETIERIRQQIEEARDVLSDAWDNVMGRALEVFDARTREIVQRLEAAFGAETTTERLLREREEAREAAEAERDLAEARQALLDVDVELARAEAEIAEERDRRVEEARRQAQDVLDDLRFRFGIHADQVPDYIRAVRDRDRAIAEAEEEAQRDIDKVRIGAEEERIKAQERLDDVLYRQETTRLRRIAEAERDAANERLDIERRRVEDERRIQRENFEERYAEILAAWRREEIAADEANSRIVSLMREYGVDYAAAGALVGNHFADAFIRALDRAIAAVNALAAAGGGGPVAGGAGGGDWVAREAARISGVTGIPAARIEEIIRQPDDAYRTGGRLGVVAMQHGGRVVDALRRRTMPGPGDVVPALLRADEVVLTAAMQRNVAGALRGGGGDVHVHLHNPTILGSRLRDAALELRGLLLQHKDANVTLGLG